MVKYLKIRKKLKRIKAVLLDVDGVLTDGGLYFDSKGNEIKKFNVKDGSGIKMAIKSGIKVGIITGRNSSIVKRRADDLGVNFVFQGVKNKGEILDKICEKMKVKPEEIAFIADDIIDLSLFKKVGLKVAVKDAHKFVKKEADIILNKKGGEGAVREFLDAVISTKKLWNKALLYYLEYGKDRKRRNI